MQYEPYKKIVHTNYGVCAIYENNPFRSSVISEATNRKIETGIPDSAYTWVFYDWCGNPIGISDEKPVGDFVESFTEKNVGSKELAEYLNKTP